VLSASATNTLGAMAVDKSGKWWVGTDAADIDEHLREHRAGGYQPDRFVHARCVCGEATFRFDANDDEGVARRTCIACGLAHYMLDSAEFAEDAELDECACPCGNETFQVAVGFAHVETRAADGDTETVGRAVKWVSVGLRCKACGILGTYADWKIDFDPTEHLYAAV
jgi:hypothetical protein